MIQFLRLLNDPSLYRYFYIVWWKEKTTIHSEQNCVGVCVCVWWLAGLIVLTWPELESEVGGATASPGLS